MFNQGEPKKSVKEGRVFITVILTSELLKRVDDFLKDFKPDETFRIPLSRHRLLVRLIEAGLDQLEKK